MNNTEFANAALNVANNYKTLYVMGCFGAPMTAKNKSRYSTNHSYNAKPARTAMIQNASADTFGFDCAGLIKGILWGWAGTKNTNYGGAKYEANKVPDTNANGMIKYCTGVSADFSNIEIGELLWLTGHVGVYVGNGKVVEATPSWKNGVQVTDIHSRKWTKHGKLPWITYIKTTATVKPATPAPAPSVAYYPAYTGSSTSLNEIFKAIGVPTKYTGTYANRKPVAEANGIANYSGTYDQNVKLKTLAKQGKLKKV